MALSLAQVVMINRGDIQLRQAQPVFCHVRLQMVARYGAAPGRDPGTDDADIDVWSSGVEVQPKI